MATKERQSNFELLKFIGMFLIIFHHIGGKIWIPIESDYTFTFIIKKLTSGWPGWIGNWIFIFSSGYFIADTKFKWKKVFKLWFQVFSISVIIGTIFFFTKENTIGWSVASTYYDFGYVAAATPITIGDYIRSFLPLFRGTNWFFNTYIIFYLFTPFLNSYLRKIKEEEHRNLVLLLLVLVIFIQWIPKEHILNFDRLTSLFNFIFGYFLITYIKQYDPKFLKHKTLNIILSISYCLLYIVFGILLFTKKELFFGIEEKLWNHTNTMSFLFIPSILLFCAFKEINIKSNKIINKISSTLFGVYVIHLHQLLSYWLVQKVFDINNHCTNLSIIPYMLYMTVVIFIVSILLELLRKIIIERPVFKLVKKLKSKILSKKLLS